MTNRETCADLAPLSVVFFLNAEANLFGGEGLDRLEALTAFVLTREGGSGTWDVTVSLVDDATLQQLHKQFLGVDTPTDVMTFPQDMETGDNHGGDIVISADHARNRAIEWGLNPGEEIRFLIVHGLLHLLGWRDETDIERQRMLERQQVLIDQFEEQ